METSKLTAEGIIGEVVRIGARMSGGEFPTEIFPIRIQRIISSLHDCQGYPVDYVAAAILAAIAVGIGNSHLVQVKRNWLESPILYMALIGRPGANKSHPLSFAFQPFIEHDYCQNQEYQKLYAEYERTMSMSKKERLEAGLDEFPQAPVRRRFLVSDITPEGLSLIHAQDSAFGRTSCRLGSRILIATITVRKNSSGFRCSMPSPQFPTARVRKVPFLSDVPISLLSVPFKRRFWANWSRASVRVTVLSTVFFS
jgi:hypothetical protein